MKKMNLAQLIAILFKAFEKEADEDLAELYYQRLKNHDPERIEKRILELIDTSKFFPRIGEILDYSSRQESADEIKFLARFRKQSGASYDKMDDDVYTVKKYIGPRIVEDAYVKDWPWIEKKALKIYHAVKSRHIELLESPHKEQAPALPSPEQPISRLPSFGEALLMGRSPNGNKHGISEK
ncbi:MAG: hypothetical protein ISQ13_00450 [Candidatus Margulisbacteria bacterium]|nr:hypothetical protein [Candidatus Margulisiibacteriota bacterium]